MTIPSELRLLAVAVQDLDAQFNARWSQDTINALEDFSVYDSARFDLWEAQADIAYAMAELILTDNNNNKEHTQP